MACSAARGGRTLSEAFAIRDGAADDLAFVLDLGRRTIGDSVSAVRVAPFELVRLNYDRLVEYARSQSHILLVAESTFERLGFALLLDSLPDEVTGIPQAFVAYMAVEPHARRRGVARSLLAAAERSARERGLPFVALMVTEDNVAARALYAQAGFVTERRLLCKAT